VKNPSSAILDSPVDEMLLRHDDLLLQTRRDSKATRPDAKTTADINANLSEDTELNVSRKLGYGVKYSVCGRSGWSMDV
jgi:hypothetical protein